MKDFTDLLKESMSNWNNGQRKVDAENFLRLIDNNQDKKSGLNKIFSDAIIENLTRTEIIDKLEKLIDGNSIGADPNWIYSQARNIFRNLQVNKEEKSYSVKNRVGQRGGFYLQENLAPKPEIRIDEENLKNFETEQEVAESKGRELEKDFYPYVKIWADNNGFDGCEITGGALPRPRWENPDLLHVSYDIGDCTLSIEWEVTSFEVKLKVEPYAIWQAANYKKFSNWSYVAFAKSEREIRDQDDGRVFDLAIEQGIGVLALEVANGIPCFREIHSPVRNTPNSAEFNNFIRDFSKKVNSIKEKIEAAKSDLQKKLEIPKISQR